jgi:hypothetical protein
MRHRRGRRRLQRAGLLAALALAGCGGEYRIRPIQLEESAALTVAADPLLQQVGLGRCTKAVTLNDVPARQLEVLPPFDEFCLGFAVSSAAITLPPAELRALIAHGLAHLELGHATQLAAPSGSSRSRARGYTQARTHPAEEEAEADRRAAERLTAAGGVAGCAGLAEVLARAAAEGERWSDWTAQHPLTPARASVARGLCTARR